MKKLIPLLAILLSSCISTKKYTGLVTMSVNDSTQISFEGMVLKRKKDVRVFVKIDSTYDEVYEAGKLKFTYGKIINYDKRRKKYRDCSIYGR